MTALLIASICTERSGGGTSLGDLVNKVRTGLSGDPVLLLRLESVVGATLGESLLHAMDEAYDLEMAQQSLRFFEVTAIPRPGGTIPKEVTDVRFVADLADVDPVDLALFTGAKGLFEAASPA